MPARRPLPRPSRLSILVAVVVLAGAVGGVVLLTRDEPPRPPAPIPASRAELRLERQLGVGGTGPRGAVRCPGAIGPERATRCEFVYPDGDTRLMLVTLSPRGRLDIEVPYPAQRRPGG